jgi:predicted AAA+ superfamily ATPase
VILRDTLAAVLADQRPSGTPGKEVARELAQALPGRSTQALVLTGVRRAGKSTLQAQLMKARGAAFYCNLEDTRLFELSARDFPNFLAIVDELAPEPAAVFLDEVQELAEWQRLVRTLLDRGRIVCITGSNASLLGRELGAKLTGRHLSFEVFPFSYSEYLAFRQRSAGADSFVAFLDEGGFPAFLRQRDPHILQELLRDVVQRDIAVRHRLRETRHVMNLALFLLANTGQPFSRHSLTRSLAIPTVPQTSRYLEYLEDAYLVFAVPKFSPSFKKRIVTPSKYYAIDNGLRRFNSPQLTPDLGHRLENAVFLALRRRGGRESVTYAAETNAWECDFVTRSEAIQVCTELTGQNRDREIRGVLKGAALPGKRRPLILTLDQTDRIEVESTAIEVQPAWAWIASLQPRNGSLPHSSPREGGAFGSNACAIRR